MNPDPSFGPEEEHQWRIHREADWQRFAAPLAVIREIREAILVQILLGEDEHETFRQNFTEILKLESELLRLAMAHYPDWTANLLNLNHVRSWREVAGDTRRPRPDRSSGQNPRFCGTSEASHQQAVPKF